MKILFQTFNPFSSFSLYKRAVGTGEALAQEGHEVYITVFDCEENRDRMAIEAPNCRALYFKGGIVKEWVSKLRYIWKIRPEVLYTTSFSVHNLACCEFLFPRGIKRILEFCELYSRYPGRRYNWSAWETLGLLGHNYILCASRFLESHFVKACKRLHLRREILYSPYAYPSYLQQVARAREKGARIKHVLFMASLGRGYGIYDVLAAFEKVAIGRHDVRLDVVGKGQEKDNAMAWVAQHGLDKKVCFHGYVPEKDLPVLLNMADVFVSPLNDTLQDRARCPSKVFYYIPYNKPIVTCRLGNPADVLGDYGFYYKPNDIGDMANILASALDVADSFSYPKGFIESQSWMARAEALERWLAK